CTLRTASSPSRAVPTTRNSSLVCTSSVMRRRMNALSSTTSTERGALENDIAPGKRSHFHHSGRDGEVHAAAMGPPHIFRHDGDARLQQRGAGRDEIALAHLQST